MSYRGMMDGWHGDELEIDERNRWAWEKDRERYEDEFHVERKESQSFRLKGSSPINVSSFDEINRSIENIKNCYQKAYGVK